MTTKRTFPPSRTGSTTRRAPVAHRLKAILGDIACLRDARTVREWKFLTLREWAGVLAVFGFKADRKTINHWERGDRDMPPAAHAAYAQAVAWRVGIESEGLLEVDLTSRWRIIVRRICDRCGRAFRFERTTTRHCRKCRR